MSSELSNSLIQGGANKANVDRVKQVQTSAPARQAEAVVPANPQREQTEVAENAKPLNDKQAENRETAAKSLHHAVSDMNDFVQSIRRELQFSINSDHGEVVIQVTDAENGDVIRQIPSDEALRLAQSLQDANQTTGRIFQDKA